MKRISWLWQLAPFVTIKTIKTLHWHKNSKSGADQLINSRSKRVLSSHLAFWLY